MTQAIGQQYKESFYAYYTKSKHTYTGAPTGLKIASAKQGREGDFWALFLPYLWKKIQETFL